MTAPLTPEAIYLRLGQLLAEAPDLKSDATSETHLWVARVLVLIEAGELVNRSDLIQFRAASQNLIGALRGSRMSMIMAIAHQALAKAELHAPAALQGAFITAGNTFDAFAAVGKVLSMVRFALWSSLPKGTRSLRGMTPAKLAPVKTHARRMVQALTGLPVFMAAVPTFFIVAFYPLALLRTLGAAMGLY